MQSYEIALKIDPSYAQAANCRMHALLALKRPPEAANTYVKI